MLPRAAAEPPRYRGDGILSARMWACLGLAVITAVGAGLRFYRIGGQGLWLDEAFSLWMARHPLGEMLRWTIGIDQHPPLYYALLHGWTAMLGDGEGAARSLSALCSLLTIPVIYGLGRRLSGGERAPGLLAALILAVSPFHVRFAQEARMYALLTLNAALALLGMLAILEPGGEHPARWPWVVYVLFTVAALLTHNTAVFLPLAANLVVLARYVTGPRPSFSLFAWIVAQAVVFMLWLPWLPALVRQSWGVYREFWLPAPTWGTVVGAVGAFLSDGLPLPPPWSWGVWGVWAALALAGVLHLRRSPGRLAFLGLVFGVPFLGEGLVSLIRPIFYDRTLIWASLPLYLLLAAGICRLGRRSLIFVLVLVLVLLVANGLSLGEYYVHHEKEAWDEAAALVAGRVQPGDLILFHASWVQIPFDYYFSRLYNDAARLKIAEHGAPVDLFERGVLEPKMTSADVPRLRELMRGRGRVWLVYSHDWYTDPERLIPQTLGEDMTPRRRWELYGVQLWLFGRR